MEEGEENDLKTRKSIIRSELADGTINESNQQPLSYHINVGPVGHTYSFYSMQNIVDDVAKSQEAIDKYTAHESNTSSSDPEQTVSKKQPGVPTDLAEEFIKSNK